MIKRNSCHVKVALFPMILWNSCQMKAASICKICRIRVIYREGSYLSLILWSLRQRRWGFNAFHNDELVDASRVNHKGWFSWESLNSPKISIMFLFPSYEVKKVSTMYKTKKWWPPTWSFQFNVPPLPVSIWITWKRYPDINHTLCPAHKSYTIML